MKKAVLRFVELKSENTKRTYLGAWNKWAKWQDHSRDGALSFVISLRKSGASDNSIRLTCSALRSINEYLVEYSKINLNPFKSIARVISARQATQVRPTKLIPFELVNVIVESPKVNTRKGVRDRALLAVLFGCGLRRSELQRLRLCDVMVSPKGSLYLELVRTKAGKRQQQPIPAWTWEHLSALTLQRRGETSEARAVLFCRYVAEQYRPDAISDRTIDRTFKRYLKLHGIDAAPHSARATGATKLLSEGVPDREVQAFLRHSSTQMVQAYDKRRRSVDDNPGRFLSFEK